MLATTVLYLSRLLAVVSLFALWSGDQRAIWWLCFIGLCFIQWSEDQARRYAAAQVARENPKTPEDVTGAIYCLHNYDHRFTMLTMRLMLSSYGTLAVSLFGLYREFATKTGN